MQWGGSAMHTAFHQNISIEFQEVCSVVLWFERVALYLNNQTEAFGESSVPKTLSLLLSSVHSFYLIKFILKWSEVAQSCPTLCDPMDCSSVHGIFQARVLDWVAISFSRGSSWPRDQTWISHTEGRCFTVWATREAPKFILVFLNVKSLYFTKIKPKEGGSYLILSSN